MRQAIVLQHVDREGPGYIADICGQRGFSVHILRLDLGVPVPASLTDGDLLVVMGGSMGVGDLEDARFPFLSHEVSLLRKVLEQEQPVLGVCLGAQLLAHAAGSRVYPNRRRDERGVLQPAREVGFGEVRLLGIEREPALAGLGKTIRVLHWHGDTFDLPAGSVHLAASDACANQAFRIGRRAFGLQFHVETDAELVRQWANDDSDFAVSALGPDGPAAIAAMSEQGVRDVGATGKRLIENILGEMIAE
jgi:GMP synthase-like glutamine amidotransferase